jgi:ATP citrate (pro-S)-lyase
MPFYRKLTEYCAKKIFNPDFPIIEINRNTPKSTISNFIKIHKYVIIKVDEFVKRRGKNGLVKKTNDFDKIIAFMNEHQKYSHFILEKTFNIIEEKYFCIQYHNNKKRYIFNDNGGINCDDPYKNATIIDSIKNYEESSIIYQLDVMFDSLYCHSLEVNPLILTDSGFLPIDFAVEFDNCGLSFWKDEHRKYYDASHKEESSSVEVEKKIAVLDEASNASLKLKVINPSGKIATLVAGGGASVLYTDAILNAVYTNELYNYGEYSGNPTEDELYQYCSLFFENWFEVVKSERILFIGGGISNFTDVAKTFKGIIRAIKKFSAQFKAQNVAVWVRRGGVGENEGLRLLKETLDELTIKNHVYGSEIPITEIVSMALCMTSVQLPEYTIEDVSLTDTPREISLWNDYIIFIGHNATIIQRILDYDYYIGREMGSILGVYDPYAKKDTYKNYFWGRQKIKILITSNISAIAIPEGSTVAVYNYLSIRSCVQATKKFADMTAVRMFYIIAEGLPEATTLELAEYLRIRGKTLLGPSSVGAIKSGINGRRIGSVGGLIDNIQRCNLATEGYVAIITKSGGLLNEMINYVERLGLVVGEAVSIGGDRYHGVRFIDLVQYYMVDDKISVIIMVGESGGIEELEATSIPQTKPVIAWCSGTSNDKFEKKIEFGHAGSSSLSVYEDASYKNYFMRKSGFVVPETFEQIGKYIEKYKKATEKTDGRIVPVDLSEAIANGLIRNVPNFSSGITDERNDLKYRSDPIDQIVEKDNSLGYTIGLIWLNIRLDNWASKFIEKILAIMADHGPAVSGAQTAIITARAGKNITESVASGILTIGSRFGGAIEDAGKDFYEAYKSKEKPADFVERMKTSGKYIMGIGHRIKSKFNPDKRVEVIKKYVASSFPEWNVLRYAIDVERITLEKKSNLILNVDGAIGACLIDLLLHYKVDVSKVHVLNGFFILARTIGFIGHYQEQKIQNNGLYRANDWDYDFLDT